jgi:hypothetical protein
MFGSKGGKVKNYTKNQLVDLLKRSHQALEAITDLYGCDFKTSMILVDSENALNGLTNSDRSINVTVLRSSSVH